MVLWGENLRNANKFKYTQINAEVYSPNRCGSCQNQLHVRCVNV